jgi:hypothetical protein
MFKAVMVFPMQRELDELLRQRRNQMLARDLSLASREKIQTDLDEVRPHVTVQDCSY